MGPGAISHYIDIYTIPTNIKTLERILREPLNDLRLYITIFFYTQLIIISIVSLVHITPYPMHISNSISL